MAYATSDLDAIIAKLERALSSGYAEVEFQGHKSTYRSVNDIRSAIAYFQSLYPTATDAPTTTKNKVRTLLFYGNKGFGV